MKNNLKKLIANAPAETTIRKLEDYFTENIQFEHITTDSVPQEEVLDIYSFRNKMWKKKKAKVEGADELLRNLEEVAEPVVIHRLDFPEESFILFTDSSESKLFGVLLTQKR